MSEFGNSLSDYGINGGELAGEAISNFGQGISQINQYDVQETGLPFQADYSNVSRRERDRMKAKVDQYNAEWKERQERRRAEIVEQREKAHQFRLQADELDNRQMDLSARFNAAMRKINKDSRNNALINESANKIFDTASEDNALKDQMIEQWGA